MSLIQMRPELYVKGLNDLIDYINRFESTSDMTMIEIGAYAGEGTEIFARRFGKVITIDPHQRDYDETDSAAKSDFDIVVSNFMEIKKRYNNIEYINMKSDDAINELKENKVGFVYIDGWHVYEQVKKDIINYKPLIKEGGFIGGHDWHPGWVSVVDAVVECLESVDQKFVDTSWIKRLA